MAITYSTPISWRWGCSSKGQADDGTAAKKGTSFLPDPICALSFDLQQPHANAIIATRELLLPNFDRGCKIAGGGRERIISSLFSRLACLCSWRILLNFVHADLSEHKRLPPSLPPSLSNFCRNPRGSTLPRLISLGKASFRQARERLQRCVPEVNMDD